MKLYAELPGRLARQVLLDLGVLTWTWLWLQAGLATHSGLLRLGEPGRDLQGAGEDLSRALGDAARRTSDVPLIGNSLAAPLSAAGDAARRLADAGAAEQSAVGRLAVLLGLAVALAPITAVVLPWAAARLRWIRRASAASSLRRAGIVSSQRQAGAVSSQRPARADDASSPRPPDEATFRHPRAGDAGDGELPAELELLALRALVTRPLPQLLRAHPSPGTAFRRGDPEAIRLLAGLELRSLGLRP